MYEEFGIDNELIKLANICEEELREIFKEIDNDALYNSQKVLMRFSKK